MLKSLSHPTLSRLEADLAALQSECQYRQLELTSGVNLCSNDYLGLSTDSRLCQAVVAELERGTPVASTGSRLLSGNSSRWEELEAELARFVGAEAALFFSSGYAANLGLLSSILRPQDVVFSDRSNHASLVDGIRLSRARKVIFPHLDLDYLEDALRRCDSGAGEKFIVVESVFSMEGDCAPLADLLTLAESYDAGLIVDEAHATGVFGAQGRGLVGAAGRPGPIVATVHTCGKALAAAGAFVAGSDTLKRYLVNRARTFIFSTALPPYCAAQIRAALRIVAAADEERKRLAGASAFLRARLRAAGFDIGRGDSQIIPVLLGSNDVALRFAAELSSAGFAIRAIRPPSVPEGTARLRLSLNVNLSPDVLENVASCLIAVRDRVASASQPRPS